jgi:hypothetical protein
MNTKTLKAFAIAVAFAGSIGATSPVMATFTSVQSLGVTENFNDVWKFTCPVLFPRGRATVQDVLIPFLPANQLIIALDQEAPAFPPDHQVTDNLPGGFPNGEAGASSGEARVNGVAGVPYYAVVKKSAAGIERYIGEFYCANFLGLRVNPVPGSITKVFNQ